VGFRVPPDADLIRLALEYRRAPGTTRLEADLWLGPVRLEFDKDEAAGGEEAGRR
jgi:hypothetical protein